MKNCNQRINGFAENNDNEILFLLVTSSFVFIKPIGRFVDKHIIEKLP